MTSPDDRPDVRAEQERLNTELAPYHFPPLVIDGDDGPRTRQARGAVAMLDELGRDTRRRSGRWVVVDKGWQVLVAGERDGTIRFVLPVTTGLPEYETRLADRLSAFRYEPASDNRGWRNSTTYPVGADDQRGGNMYRPIYFDRGTALHGSMQVPAHPNTQGCVCLSPGHQDLLVAWLGLDDTTTPIWDPQRIDLTVTVRGRFPGDEQPHQPASGGSSGTTAPSGRPTPARTARRQPAATSPHLPDTDQQLLVRAAIAGGDDGLAAWRTWLEQVGPDDGRFDTGSERLLPLVYSSLSRQHADLPGRELLGARYRRSWYMHNLLVHRAKPALAALLDAGHSVMVVKGVSLAARYYDDRGARTITDVDVVVREEEATAALEVLLRNGWRCSDPDISAEVLFARSHAVGLVDGRGGQLDLHRRMLYLSRSGLDGPVWDRAVPTVLDNVTVLTPCAADELLLTVVHGWAWSAVSSIRWIPDVAAIVAHLDTDGWQTLIDESRRRQVSYRVWTALRAAHDQYDVAVPTSVLEEMARGPFASFEVSEERWHTRAHGRVPPGVFAYYEHVRQVGSPNGLRWWMDYAVYYLSLVSGPEGGNPVSWLVEKVKRRFARRSLR